MVKILLFSLLFLISGAAMAQDTISYMNGQDVGTNRIMTNLRFNETNIRPYLGDASELYLEYGLKEMVVQEVLYKQVIIRVEFYLMKDMDGAYGVYSVNKRNCTKTAFLTRFDCVSLKQISFVMGKQYVNITSTFTSPEVGDLMLDLAKKIVNKFGFKDWNYPTFFDAPVFYPNITKTKLIRGATAFNQVYPEWTKKFKGLYYQVVMIPNDFNGSSCVVGQVTFRTLMEMERFITQNGFEQKGLGGAFIKDEGKTKQFLMVNGTREVFLMETWGQSKELDDYRSKVESHIRNFIKSGKQK